MQYTSLDAVIIATQYKKTMKKALIKIKYGLSYDILEELMKKTLLSEKIKSFLTTENIHFCTEIPMHSYKERKRGFNQTTMIAKWVEQRYSIPHYSILEKTRQTQAQMSLKRADRIFNITNAFKLKSQQNINEKNILIIDDVITTGTTLEEAAKVLKNNKAGKIIALVMAGN